MEITSRIAILLLVASLARKGTMSAVDEKFIGCFTHGADVFSKQADSLSTFNTPDCIEECNGLAYPLAGIEGSKCFCEGTDNAVKLRVHNTSCGDAGILKVYRTTDGNYIGCFNDEYSRVLQSETRQILSDQTVSKCSARCEELGYPLAGVENKEECFCGGKLGDSDNVYRLGRADNCNMPCNGDADTVCGGEWALSVYKNGAMYDNLYLGCFHDYPQALRLPFKSTAVTIQQCVNNCKALGYKFAGAKNGTLCFCGSDDKDDIAVYKYGRSVECTTPCKNDSSRICGGVNALSVYRTSEETYLGCLLDDGNTVLTRVLDLSTEQISDDQTIPKCMAYCKSLGHQLAGVSGKRCTCGGKPGDNVYQRGPIDACITPCPGDSNTICGGVGKASSVYKVSKWSYDDLGDYLDCFKDDSARVLNASPALVRKYGMTIPTCIAHCKSLNHPLAGIENYWECWCGRSSPNRIGRSTGCLRYCPGDKSTVCGGSWALSTYLTGIPFN